jgi:membrane protein
MAAHAPRHRGGGQSPRQPDTEPEVPARTTGGAGQPDPSPEEQPTSPLGLDKRSWKGVLRRAMREYKEDALSDWAAALTYRAILALFPGLLVLVSIVGLLGSDTSANLLDNLQKNAPASVRGTINTIFENVQNNHGAAGIIGILSLLLALWSASGYVAAFMRASNNIYDILEGRPIWKTAPIRLGLTIFLVIVVILAAGIAVLSGGIARDVGNVVGLGSTAVTVWNIAKWPFLLVVAILALALLFWAAPNAKQANFKWITPGGLLTVIVWVAASAGFAVYVANFGSYNKTYGSLAGIVVFLIWLWISNIALLLGAEFDAELQRARAIDQGLPPDQEPYVDLRDDRKLDDVQRERFGEISHQLHQD